MGTQIAPDYFPKKINQFVPAMAFSADVIHGAPHFANLGAPAALDADGLWDGVSATDSAQTHLAAAMKSTYDQEAGLSGNFGRNVTMVGTAGSNHVCTAHGRDYLGQPMQEQFTLSGTTPQVGTKAFKWLDKLTIATGAAGDTVDVGWADVLGLPYATQVLGKELEDAAAASAGTFVATVTAVQTVSTGDPRGTYDPNSACDGTKVFEVECFTNRVNLHGNAHFFV